MDALTLFVAASQTLIGYVALIVLLLDWAVSKRARNLWWSGAAIAFAFATIDHMQAPAAWANYWVFASYIIGFALAIPVALAERRAPHLQVDTILHTDPACLALTIINTGKTTAKNVTVNIVGSTAERDHDVCDHVIGTLTPGGIETVTLDHWRICRVRATHAAPAITLKTLAPTLTLTVIAVVFSILLVRYGA